MTEPRDFAYSLRAVGVVFAEGAVARLADAIDSTLTVARLFIVSTPGRAPVVETIRATLGDRVTGVFDGATPHVPATLVTRALEALRQSTAEAVVAVGGGSTIGLGKALARETGLPLIAVPSTYSGSEMTDIWGVTEGGRKVTGRDARAAPRVVVYDPAITYDMPATVTGPSGMNAIAHGVEALYSETGSPVASLLAADGIRRLAAALPLLAGESGNREARWDALYGAHLCGRALDMTSMGLHHKLCHVLGGTLGLPHALTHAVVLPHVAAYNAGAAPAAMETIAASLAEEDAAQGLWRLNRKLGIDRTLADLGMQPSAVDRVIDEVLGATYPNPAPVTADGLRALLEDALEGNRPDSGPATSRS